VTGRASAVDVRVPSHHAEIERQPGPVNICEAFSENGDITLCTREREKVLIMRDQEKIQVRSLRAPRENSYIEHTRPFSPTCTCEACRKLTSEHPSSRTVKSSQSHLRDGTVAVPMRVGDRVRCKAQRPGYREARMSEGLVEYIGKRRGNGARVFVGINLGMATGDTDGYVEGERLFRVAPKHGVVVPLEDVISYFSLKSQSFVPLYMPAAPGYTAPEPRLKKSKKKKRPSSANSSVSSRASNVDERYNKSPYLQSLINLDPSLAEYKALNKSFNSLMLNKPRISRPIPRERMRHRSFA